MTMTTKVHEPSFEKKILDRKIYVFNFPPIPKAYSICPFAIKLESFMRINQVSYESVYGSTFSSKRQMPYIRLDNHEKELGEEIADSNVVIGRLCNELNESSSEFHLSSQQRAMTHFLIRTLEEHTQQIGFYYRYGLHMELFLDVCDIEHRFHPTTAIFWPQVQPEMTLNRTKVRGLSRHSDKEIWGFSNDDIQAIADMMGDQKFLLGGDKPTLADCAVFGHLSQFLYIVGETFEFPQRRYMIDNCPNLVNFMNRFRATYWSDWDELCNIKIDYANDEMNVFKKQTF